MGILKLSGLMAFCMEYTNGTNTVYFVESDSMGLAEPGIHKYYCSKKQFDSVALGGEYTLRVRGRRIVELTLDSEYDIDEEYYQYLLHYKQRSYGGGASKRFDPDDYYTFSEQLQLIDYRETPAMRALNGLLRFLVYLPALAISPFLYILILILVLPGSGSVGAPVFSVLTLPMMVFLLAFFYQGAQFLLLRWERTRYGMLRSYSLRHGGARLSLNPSADAKAWMIGFGTVAGGMTLLGIIMLIIL